MPSRRCRVLLQPKSSSRQTAMSKRLASREQPSVRQAHRTCTKPSATLALVCSVIRRQNAGSLSSSAAGLLPGSETQQTFRCLRSAQSHLHRCASVLVALRSGHLLAQPHSPNPSVKGTSCGKPPLTSNVRPSAGRSPTQLKRRLPMSVFQGLSRDAFCHRERRARFSVGLGCPSFGGQREVGGRFNLPPAKSVNKLKPWRHVASHQCLRSRPELEVGAATGLVLPPWQADQTEIATASVLHSPANGGRVASPVPLGSACLARQLHHGWCISGA